MFTRFLWDFKIHEVLKLPFDWHTKKTKGRKHEMRSHNFFLQIYSRKICGNQFFVSNVITFIIYKSCRKSPLSRPPPHLILISLSFLNFFPFLFTNKLNYRTVIYTLISFKYSVATYRYNNNKYIGTPKAERE